MQTGLREDAYGYIRLYDVVYINSPRLTDTNHYAIHHRVVSPERRWHY
jgi:hypothetical protein